MSYTPQFTKTLILLAGYLYIQNANISGCLRFCRQDENCASFVYSELAPPFKGSYCSFHNNTISWSILKVPEKKSSTGQSYLIILESGEKDLEKNRYKGAFLNGNYFWRGNTSDDLSCRKACLRNHFCDAVSIASVYVKAWSTDCFFFFIQGKTS